jgi:anti-anti-sigma regulatory factor
MLKISGGTSPNGKVTLRLEGQVSGPWVEELRRSCERILATGGGLILDLAEVSFVDRDGVALCGRLQSRHVTFLHCSPFVTEQLKQ